MVLAADVDERSATLIRDPIVHIHIYPVQSLSRRKAARLGVFILILGVFIWLVVAIVVAMWEH
jgi:uncharacterized membrane protein